MKYFIWQQTSGCQNVLTVQVIEPKVPSHVYFCGSSCSKTYSSFSSSAPPPFPPLLSVCLSLTLSSSLFSLSFPSSHCTTFSYFPLSPFPSQIKTKMSSNFVFFRSVFDLFRLTLNFLIKSETNIVKIQIQICIRFSIKIRDDYDII